VHSLASSDPLLPHISQLSLLHIVRTDILLFFFIRKKDVSVQFSFVGYDPVGDKAIVQSSNEGSATMIPAAEALGLVGNRRVNRESMSQLMEARKAAGKV